MTTFESFKSSIASDEKPSGLSPALQALWYDGLGDWGKAHSLIDHLSDPISAHIHAYLHRKEGDIWNADYWYARANRVRPTHSLEDEWDALVAEYLKGNS